MPEIKGPHKDFALRIQKFRVEKKLTGTELGAIVGITKGAINHWENGGTNPKNIASKHMDKLVRYSGKSPSYWIEGKDLDKQVETDKSEFGEHTQNVIKFVLENVPENTSNKDIALICQLLFNKTKHNRIITEKDLNDILDMF